MNSRIRGVGIALMLLFVALFVRLNQLQVIQAKQLAESPGNTRIALRDFGEARGSILSADGRVLARSLANPDTKSAIKFMREYPGGTLYAHLTGYFSFTYGAVGVEKRYNDDLSGRRRPVSADRLRDLLKDLTVTSDVVLTIDDKVQRAAARALGQRRGSIVALDPRSGAILAMVSYPSYDPSPLAAIDQGTVRAAWRELNDDPTHPALARAYRERLPPGSTFKVVTTAAGLGSGLVTPETEFPKLSELPLRLTNRPLRNFGGSTCGGTLLDSFRVSCNTSFAQLGLDLGPQQLRDTAVAFGLDNAPPLDLAPGAVSSSFPDVDFFDRNDPALAQSAIGQGEVAATPLSMALVAAAIANGGEIPSPHVVTEIREMGNGPDQPPTSTERITPGAWRRATSPETAATLAGFMETAVTNGTGTRAQIAGVRVAAKTGTAQTGRDTAHAWTIAFAPVEAPVVAIAVVVEDQPEVSTATGGRVAAPIVARVIEAALADR